MSECLSTTVINHVKNSGLDVIDNGDLLKGLPRMGHAVWHLSVFAQIASYTSVFLTWIGITLGACALAGTGNKIG